MIKMNRRMALGSLFVSTIAGRFCGGAQSWGAVGEDADALNWANDVLRFKKIARFETAPVLTGLTLQPRGSHMAIAGDDNRVRICNRETGELVHLLTGHSEWVRDLAFSPDGEFLLSAGYDGRLLKWEVETGELAGEVYRASFPIAAMVLSQTTPIACVVGFSRKVCWLNWAESGCVGEANVDCQDLRAVAVSPNGNTWITGGRNGLVYGLDRKTGRTTWEKAVHRRRIRDLKFSSDGQRIYSCGEDARIHVTHVHDAAKSFSLQSQHTKGQAIEPLGNGLIASAGTNNEIAIWDTQRRRLLGKLVGHDGSVTSLAFDGDRLYSSGYDTTVRIWKANPRFAEQSQTGIRVGRDPNTSQNSNK